MISDVAAELPFVHEFPETKYMGSKQRLLPFILKHVSKLKFNSALDAFSGSACVGYAIKETGVQVFANDFLSFCFHTARATIENNSTVLTEEDVSKLLQSAVSAPTFVRDTFKGLYFDENDCEFLDNLWANIQQMKSRLKISIALAAVSRACMKKRPRGLFTFTGHKGWDERMDLKLSMREQFLMAVNVFNAAVFSNGQENKTFNQDVFSLPPDIADLVYIDTPYISPFSDCDYTRRYHFVEGYCRYWNGCEIMTHTSTKKIRSYKTAFSTKATAQQAFQCLFQHFRKSKLAVSYSSNCIPDKKTMIELLKAEKSKVTVHEASHRYHHGNHAHNNHQIHELEVKHGIHAVVAVKDPHRISPKHNQNLQRQRTRRLKLKRIEELETPRGRELIATRSCSVEPVFGIIKHAMGFRGFLQRGKEEVANEWNLLSAAFNLKRLLHLLMPA